MMTMMTRMMFVAVFCCRLMGKVPFDDNVYFC